MNNMGTGHRLKPDVSTRNLHYGRYVAIPHSSLQTRLLKEHPKWVIAAVLPQSLRSALDTEYRPVVRLARLCVGAELRATLVTVSTKHIEVHFVFAHGDERMHHWYMESARVNALTFVVVVPGDSQPFGIHADDFDSLQQYWPAAPSSTAGTLTDEALLDASADVTGILMAKHLESDIGQSDTPRDRHYVLVTNGAFSLQAGVTLDAIVNAWLACRPRPI
ncbi:MAG: hypothetical protein IH627_13105 [Rubrivivax sp.]|nr:hypothetical protein [Rubrivivax sp.]